MKQILRKVIVTIVMNQVTKIMKETMSEALRNAFELCPTKKLTGSGEKKDNNPIIYEFSENGGVREELLNEFVRTTICT
jgi:hypothetical protein